MGNEKIVFELTEKEKQRYIEFCKAHEKCDACSMGEKFLISFMPTGLGDCVSIRCFACGKHQDITDIDKL